MAQPSSESNSFFDEMLFRPPLTHHSSVDQPLNPHVQHADPNFSSAKLDNSPQYHMDQQQQQPPRQSILLPLSPATSPQSSLELSSIQIDKNRERLKHKLTHRASIGELVCRGIYPSPRTPVAHAEQRRKLERAKTRDLLRHHIQSRPDREYLVGQNILQGDSRVDFRIAARQKELKKCRLAENLSQHLVTRPGPLDLVDRNILEAPQQLHIALRSGLLTSKFDQEDGTATATIQSPFYTTSQDVTAPSPAAFVFDPAVGTGSTVVHSASVPTPGSATDAAISMILPANQQIAVYTPLNTLSGVVAKSAANSCDYLILPQSEATSQVHPPPPPPLPPPPPALAPSISQASIRKSSSKSTKILNGSSIRQKTPMLKFHEYKGPPEIVKASKLQQQPQNTDYTKRMHAKSDSAAREHLTALINQQILYLKYQSGSPTSSVLAPSTSSGLSVSLSGSLTESMGSNNSSGVIHSMSSSISSTVPNSIDNSDNFIHHSNPNSGYQNKLITRQTLADLRVSELKSYCRQLDLPISGTKQTLINRLDARLNQFSRSYQQQKQVHYERNSHQAFHSSSALFSDDSIANYPGADSMISTPDYSKSTRPEDDTDDVITISSSASSPGIVHEADCQSNSTNHIVWPQQEQQNTEQIMKLHNRVESQQRHIEQLKAELEFERQKRMDDSRPASMEVPEEATPVNIDAWPESNTQPLTDTPAPVNGAQIFSPNGISDIDDIMELIGSFPDIHNGRSPFLSPADDSSVTLKSPGHTGDLGPSATSPMSPWLFENDPLGLGNPSGTSGLLEQTGNWR